jgi:hypothetical protein
MVKWTKNAHIQIQNFKYDNFQYKYKKIHSKFFKSLIMEASMLLLNFDELNAKFEKFQYHKYS